MKDKMTKSERAQDFGMRAEQFVYRTAWIWMLLFILGIMSFAVYVNVKVWYECRSDHSFFYCLSLIST